jgi:hypothetical protein
MFAIVEHEQGLPPCEMVRERLDRRSGLVEDAELLGERERDRIRLPNVGEVDQAGTIRHDGLQSSGDLEGHGRLAGAAGTREGHKTSITVEHAVSNRLDLRVATDDADPTRRQSGPSVDQRHPFESGSVDVPHPSPSEVRPV